MMTLLIHTDSDIGILLRQCFSDKNILSLLSDQLRHIFYDLYLAQILGQGRLDSSNLDETAAVVWVVLQSNEVMAEFSMHDIKRHPSITSIFVSFLVTAKISESLQEIYQMKKNIKVLSTGSYRHDGRLAKIKGRGESEGWLLG